MNVNHKQIKEISQNRIPILIASSLTAILIMGCQTVGTKQNRRMVHILSEQETLIGTLLDERNQEKVKMQVAKNETLTTAELHLEASLIALRQSNQSLKEALKNEQK